MRVLGVDFGQRRLGLALSDARAVLARPWKTVEAAETPAASAMRLADLLNASRADPASEVEDLAIIVVGLPRRLDGRNTDQTAFARQFAEHLQQRTGLPVHLQDERLTSHEAEARLAVREKDWRRRKRQIDAAAAAIILQEFLDVRARSVSAAADPSLDID